MVFAFGREEVIYSLPLSSSYECGTIKFTTDHEHEFRGRDSRCDLCKMLLLIHPLQSEEIGTMKEVYVESTIKMHSVDWRSSWTPILLNLPMNGRTALPLAVLSGAYHKQPFDTHLTRACVKHELDSSTDIVCIRYRSRFSRDNINVVT